jgi:hypothetical protein
MAILTTVTSQENTIANFASGKITTDAGAAADTTISLGFKPRYVMWLIQVGGTPPVTLEWFDPMPSLTSIRTVATGVQTVDAAGLTVNGPGLPTAAASAIIGGVAGNNFMVKAADIPASGTFLWYALG